jgi:outer membrane protein TolC
MKQTLLLAFLLTTVSKGVVGQTPADTVALSLDQARARATVQSEEIHLARSQVDIAKAQIRDARAGALPQINASLGYTRTFSSQFEGGFELPDSLKFEPDSLAPIDQRVQYLEDKSVNAGLEGLGMLFGNLPFGQENAYATTISGSQLLYSGGRTGAALAIARNFREAAELQLQEETADIDLAVRTAYYRALFALELERIAAAAVVQAEQFLDQERLREKTGVASELDVLRAEVALANLKPQAVEARSAAEIAALDLKRLVNVPAAQPLRLTTTLEAPAPNRLAPPEFAPDETLARRAAIAAAERQVRMRELAVRIARARSCRPSRCKCRMADLPSRLMHFGLAASTGARTGARCSACRFRSSMDCGALRKSIRRLPSSIRLACGSRNCAKAFSSSITRLWASGSARRQPSRLVKLP